MDRLRGLVASLALSLLVGCHLTGELPVDLGEGHGRVDRTFTASLPNSVRATLGCARRRGRPAQRGARSGPTTPPPTSASRAGRPRPTTDFFPDNDAFRDLFDAAAAERQRGGSRSPSRRSCWPTRGKPATADRSASSSGRNPPTRSEDAGHGADRPRRRRRPGASSSSTRIADRLDARCPRRSRRCRPCRTDVRAWACSAPCRGRGWPEDDNPGAAALAMTLPGASAGRRGLVRWGDQAMVASTTGRSAPSPASR